MLEGLWNSFSLNNWTLFRLMGASRTVIRLWIKVISKLASCPGQLASNYLHHKDTRNLGLELYFEKKRIYNSACLQFAVKENLLLYILEIFTIKITITYTKQVPNNFYFVRHKTPILWTLHNFWAKSMANGSASSKWNGCKVDEARFNYNSHIKIQNMINHRHVPCSSSEEMSWTNWELRRNFWE